MPTNVPVPTFGPNGVVLPSEAAILAGVFADLNAAFNVSFEPSLTTPQGQWASSEAAALGDSYAFLAWILNQFDPAYAEGRAQDALGRIYFLSRNPAQPTVVQCLCGGLAGVIIPVGALARAADGNLYVCQQLGTIPVSGSVTLPFGCAVTGPVPCPAGSLDSGSAPGVGIYQAIFGWDTIANPADGVLGNAVESRSQFEARRQQTVAGNSVGMLTSIQGAVLKVANVLDAYCTENYTSSPVIRGGVSLGPNSLYVCALGGNPQDVATAIWTKKMPGCAYNGNTTLTVVDPSPFYNPPAPSYFVTYETPTVVPFAVLVQIANGPLVPNNALSLVQAAIIAAFAGADGGSRARIGSIVYASRYYGPVVALGAWAVPIVSILLGTAPIASFAGSISGNTLAVTHLNSLTGPVFGFAEADDPLVDALGRAPFADYQEAPLAPGQLLRDVDGLILPGTTITQFGTGKGSIGTYRVSQPQSVASETMTATPMEGEVQMDIDQAPAITAADIFLVLQ